MASLVEIIIEATDKASKVFSDADKNFQNLGKNISKVGLGMTAAFTVPLAALGNSSIEAAASLQDNMGKVGTIFQGNATEIQKWADTAATSFGYSKGQALEAANKIGLMFAGLGAPTDQAAKMSESIVQLSTDFATFADMTPTEALDMLQSGLAGRGMELKKFGIDLDASKVKSEALAMGLGTATGELSEGDLAMARYSLIMKGTTKIQGDFNNSLGEADGKAILLNAQYQTMQETLGTQLLPIKMQLMTAVTGLITAFNNLSPGAQKTIIVFGGILAAAGPLLMIVGQIITVVGALGPVFTAISTAAGAIGPVFAGIASAIGTVIPVLGTIAAAITGPVLLAIAALAAGIALLYVGWKNNWFGIQDSFRLVTDNIKAVFQAFLLILKGDWAGAGEVLKTSFSATWDEIKRRFEAIKTTLGNIAKSVGDFITKGLVDGVKNAASSLISAVTGVVNSALSAAKRLLGIKSPSSVFSLVGQQMMAGMAQGIRGGVGMPVGALVQATPQLVGAASGVNITMHNSINNGLDVEYLAYRVAKVIRSGQR